MSNLKETATKIRKDLKSKLGYSSRQVSVRASICGFSAVIKIYAKDLEIPLAPIEKLVEEHESYDRDERTGEILSGGNTFICVEHHYDLK